MTATKPPPKPAPPPPQTHAGATLTAERLAEISGISARQLRNIARDGHFPPPEHGVYQAGPALLGMIRYLREQRAKKNDTLKREQQELTKARREKIQEELAILRGDHVPRAEVGPALRNISLNQRAALIHKLEREMAPRLEGRTAAERMVLIKQVVDDVCGVFAEGISKWTTEKVI